jgi:osmotically-inducible protein OsmY
MIRRHDHAGRAGVFPATARRRPPTAVLLAAAAIAAPAAAQDPAAAEPAATPGSAPMGETAAAGAVRSGDARLASQIGQQLAWDRELARFDLDVRVNDAMVHLSGDVATTPQSHRARRLVEAIPAVNAVVNAIDVDPSLAVPGGEEPPPPDDATLRERIETTLARDADVDAGNIDIQVRDGVVTLTGSVPGFGARQRAVYAARDLYGVAQVIDELAVTGGR